MGSAVSPRLVVNKIRKGVDLGGGLNFLYEMKICITFVWIMQSTSFFYSSKIKKQKTTSESIMVIWRHMNKWRQIKDLGVFWNILEPKWRHKVMNISEKLFCVIILLLWKNEVVCIIQTKVMYVFILYEKFSSPLN